MCEYQLLYVHVLNSSLISFSIVRLQGFFLVDFRVYRIAQTPFFYHLLLHLNDFPVRSTPLRRSRQLVTLQSIHSTKMATGTFWLSLIPMLLTGTRLIQAWSGQGNPFQVICTGRGSVIPYIWHCMIEVSRNLTTTIRIIYSDCLSRLLCRGSSSLASVRNSLCMK